MTAGRQLTLDLGHRPAFGRDDFLVSTANKEAVEWIDRYPAWPGYGLALVGPAGSGKTHLAQVFSGATTAAVLSAASLVTTDIGALTAANHAVVVEHDGAAFDERALLHFLNALNERGGHVLLTSREAPARWGVKLADLHSRLSVIPIVRIAVPDDVLLEAVLIKLFADRQLTVAPDVVAYVLRHMDRSFAALRAIVARADAESLTGQRAVTVPLIKTLLGNDA